MKDKSRTLPPSLTHTHKHYVLHVRLVKVVPFAPPNLVHATTGAQAPDLRLDPRRRGVVGRLQGQRVWNGRDAPSRGSRVGGSMFRLFHPSFHLHSLYSIRKSSHRSFFFSPKITVGPASPIFGFSTRFTIFYRVPKIEGNVYLWSNNTTSTTQQAGKHQTWLEGCRSRAHRDATRVSWTRHPSGGSDTRPRRARGPRARILEVSQGHKRTQDEHLGEASPGKARVKCRWPEGVETVTVCLFERES